ncbi:sensor histidine kinase [Altererythrobacter aurantiacus]|uniref:histidine kinase n=1 Tax=Parapontixanthobacter aurantiacus TaxID=1463599 RepID=A0A844ZI41_9SPHN|nr:HAMP domain-containing sensor histidine kinase [Parapontixanthobacter aurantiacus]MXO85379.1 sensor histidine kinase [Parapontixanthobacter aurantiacus]
MIDTLDKPLIEGRCDANGWLIEAGDALAELQADCGGAIPGPVAVPQLAELVRKTKEYGFRIARQIRAFDGEHEIRAWIELTPHFAIGGSQTSGAERGAPEYAGTRIAIFSWNKQREDLASASSMANRSEDAEKLLSELALRLGPNEEIVSVDASAPDTISAAKKMKAAIGQSWRHLVVFNDHDDIDESHWRVLNGARCTLPGSKRHWKISFQPLKPDAGQPTGFMLYLIPDSAFIAPEQSDKQVASATFDLIGRDLSPVLRQPIARIIANAETIRTKLAGPIDDAYSDYASDIAAAGQHLLNLIDDVGDLEAVEDAEFSTAPDIIDLAEVARRAASILRGKASERGISLIMPQKGESLTATGEFRRVLQVLLNLLGNAVRYSPESSQIWLCLDETEDEAMLTVADQGAGLSESQQAKVFDKFERLGRSGDGGTGLGLYISRKIARAMGGDLSVESAPGQGARFTLSIPKNSHGTN